MTQLWMFKSNKLHMFVTAETYQKARERFISLLDDYIRKEQASILDELIEITELTPDGKINPMNSNIEFTEDWLTELGISMDIIFLGA